MEHNTIKVLLVEDNIDDAELLDEHISDIDSVNISLKHVERINDALHAMEEDLFDVILLDLSLPDSHGLETLHKIHSQSKEIPIVVLTGLNDETIAMQAIQQGAQDYIFKNQIDGQILHRSLIYAIERRKMIQELKSANQKIIEQQKSVIEEERLKVLLEMAGATAHELNQPLTILLGNITLLETAKHDYEKVAKIITEIEKAGTRISDITSKIQQVKNYKTRKYSETLDIIELNDTKNVLVLEDSPVDFENLLSFFKELKNYNILKAVNLNEAYDKIENEQIDVVLSDYILPDGNGIDFIKTLTSKDSAIPVILITGYGSEIVASQAIQAGAYDYLPKKNINENSILRSINNALEKAQLKKEIKMTKKKLIEISVMSIRDELTGLYNRRYLNEHLAKEIKRAKRYQTDLSCMMIDLDHFKKINDSLGHNFGDFVLKEFAKSIESNIRASDISIRYGGEEFIIILPNTNKEGALQSAENIRKFYEQKIYENNGDKKTVTVSIGVVSSNSAHHLQADYLIAQADKALYLAKSNGRNRVECFQNELLESTIIMN